ncbi:monocarboxylate permease-like protein [Xylaria bambusicola]|uniref:monocarboxylate permease-like protein n=1 Tax=Xylaria bambusicola TaxID=326684 RepID=UPI0020088161|nr:monocarboxylate permease-like protein [Xylaria bambusicola]KAI0502781.1 monocarboxylate permease-like protein [Xylaria bambusicola]
MDPSDSSAPVSVPEKDDQPADPTPQPTGQHDFPEGGARAWGVASGASLVSFCTLGYVTSFGVFQTYYIQHQLSDESPSTIAWIGSLQFFFIFSAGLVAGPLFDRHGAKILFPACIIYVASVMLTSISSQYWHFILAQGILGGVSSGMVLNPAFAAAPQYFFRKRGAAMGLVVAGSSVGGVIFPLALPRLFDISKLGFGWAVRIIGFIILALLALSCIAIKERLPPRKNKFFLPRALTEVTYALVIASGFVINLGIFTPYFFLPEYALSRGVDPLFSNYLVAILNGSSFFGRLILGTLSDRAGRLNIFATAAVISSILLFVWTHATTKGAIITFTVFYGFFSGGTSSCFSTSLASAASNPSNTGTYIGQGSAIGALASLIGPPVNGAFLARYGRFDQLAIFSAVACLIGTVTILTAKTTTKAGLKGVV